MRFSLLCTLFLVSACSGGEGSTPTTPTTTAGATEIEIGECEGNGSGSYRGTSTGTGDDTGALPPEYSATATDDGRLEVHLDNARANCCPSPAATFTADGSDVTLDFVDVNAASSCDCMCIIDFVATSAPMASGDYDVTVVYNGTTEGTFPVTVP